MKKLTALLVLVTAGMLACGGGDSDSGNNDAVPPIAGIDLEGNTWKLTDDLDLTEPLTVPDGISINLNGHTITGQDKITVKISSPSGFESFRQMLSPELNGINAELLNDIDMKGAELEALSAENLFAMYSGTIDGRNCTIKNIGNIKPFVYENLITASFFPSMNNATIKNLSVDKLIIDIESSDNMLIISSLSPALINCIIDSCSISGNIKASGNNSICVAGLIGGESGEYVLRNSSFNGEIEVSRTENSNCIVGGLFISCGKSTVENCFHHGSITVNSTAAENISIGGIGMTIPSSLKGNNTVVNCCHTGTITGPAGAEIAEGVYFKDNNNTLKNIFSTGTNVCTGAGTGSALSDIYYIDDSYKVNYVLSDENASYANGSSLTDALNDWVAKANAEEPGKYRSWKTGSEGPVFK